jgi:hypothetical protein
MYTDYWTFILGILLAFLIFFLPEGVFGYALKISSSRESTDRSQAAVAEEA